MSDVSEFVDANREWLEVQAQSDMPAAWVASALLEEYPSTQGAMGE